jgi:hypothetical protein
MHAQISLMRGPQRFSACRTRHLRKDLGDVARLVDTRTLQSPGGIGKANGFR